MIKPSIVPEPNSEEVKRTFVASDITKPIKKIMATTLSSGKKNREKYRTILFNCITSLARRNSKLMLNPNKNATQSVYSLSRRWLRADRFTMENKKLACFTISANNPPMAHDVIPNKVLRK